MNSKLLASFLILAAFAVYAQGETNHPKYLFIRDITLEGNSSISSSEIIEVLGIRKGDILNQERIRSGLRRVERLYRDRGYLYAQVVQVMPWIFDSDAILKLVIDEGIIERIDVVGNTRTQREIIERELLFGVGDSFNRDDVKESERILRRKSYLGDVSITSERNPNTGGIVVTVKLMDLWTFFPVISMPVSSEENSKLILGLTDTNLFGLGQSFSLRFEREYFGGNDSEIEIEFTEPRLVGTHWNLSASYSRKNIGDSWKLLMMRPLYAMRAKWSAKILAASSNTIIPFYRGGNAVAEYNRKLNVWDFSLTRSTGTRRRYTRFTIWYLYRDSKYELQWSKKETNEPDDLKSATIGVSAHHGATTFVQDTFIDKLGEIEDIELGTKYEVRLGRSDKLIGSGVNRNSVSASAFSTTRSDGGYLWSELLLSTFVEGNSLTDYLFTGQIKYLSKEFSRNTFSMRARCQIGTGDPASDQITLGSNSGLRGYKPNRFDGNRVMLINTEIRLFFLDTRYAIFGGVLFGDMGYIWSSDSNFDLGRPRCAIGAGLRVELPLLNGLPIYHLDFGYPLDREPGDPRWHISFGMGHVF